MYINSFFFQRKKSNLEGLHFKLNRMENSFRYVEVYFSEHTVVFKYTGQTILNYSFLRIKSYEYRMNIKAKVNQGR